MDQSGGAGRVVIAGGTGLVGRHLSAALAASGRDVTILSRSAPAAAFPPGIQVHSWENLPATLDGANAVINLSGAGIADARWTPARKQILARSRVDPTRRLAQALGATPRRPPVLVNASAVGIYGPRDERPVTEDQPPGQGFLADLCRAWEAAADEAAIHGVRVVHLRLGIVLARDGGALPRMAQPARFGLGAKLGDGRQGMSWIHVDDLVALVQAALTHPAWQGPVNATAPFPESNAAFTRALCRRLHRPMPPVPAWLTRTALGLLLGEMGEAVLLQGAYVLPAKAQALGFQFRFPHLPEALQDLLP